jgi:hypothetical protein
MQKLSFLLEDMPWKLLSNERVQEAQIIGGILVHIRYLEIYGKAGLL